LSHEEYFVQKRFYHPLLITGFERFRAVLAIGVIAQTITQHIDGQEGNSLREDF
jgi:hypothetical protein